MTIHYNHLLYLFCGAAHKIFICLYFGGFYLLIFIYRFDSKRTQIQMHGKRCLFSLFGQIAINYVVWFGSSNNCTLYRRVYCFYSRCVLAASVCVYGALICHLISLFILFIFILVRIGWWTNDMYCI